MPKFVASFTCMVPVQATRVIEAETMAAAKEIAVTMERPPAKAFRFVAENVDLAEKVTMFVAPISSALQ